MQTPEDSRDRLIRRSEKDRQAGHSSACLPLTQSDHNKLRQHQASKKTVTIVNWPKQSTKAATQHLSSINQQAIKQPRIFDADLW
jgi:hypothetical protein